MNLKVLGGVAASVLLTSSFALAANSSDLEKVLKEVRAMKRPNQRPTSMYRRHPLPRDPQYKDRGCRGRETA